MRKYAIGSTGNFNGLVKVYSPITTGFYVKLHCVRNIIVKLFCPVQHNGRHNKEY